MVNATALIYFSKKYHQFKIIMRNHDTQFLYWGLKIAAIVILAIWCIYIIIRHPESGFQEFRASYICQDSSNVPDKLDPDYVSGSKYVEENFENLDQFDPELIRYIRVRYITPPSPQSTPYYFKLSKSQHPTEYSKYIRKLFKDKRQGVFIEAGANEGESHSHTLELEEDLGWSGLLVECNPTVTPYLKTHRRRAWVAGVCISAGAHPSVVNFSNPDKWTYSGRMGPAWNLPVASNWTYFDVETVPLYSIIAATGIKEIDYFSFDVEGIELEILKHFPFDRIQINVLILEVHFLTKEEKKELQELLEANKMKLIEVKDYDQIYMHESFKAP